MIPDRDEDIKPRFHKSKIAAGLVNGEVSFQSSMDFTEVFLFLALF